MTRVRTFLMTGPSLALVAAVIFSPILLLIRVSLYKPASGIGFYTPSTVTLENYRGLFDFYFFKIIAFTAGFGILVASLVVLAGFGLALFLRTITGKQRALALTLILIPKSAGMLASLFGLQRWLPRGMLGALIGEVYLILPYAALVLYVQLLAVQPALLDAARGLGANSWQAFLRVTIPLSKPGLWVAFQFGLLWGLGAFLGPVFLGGPDQTTLSVELHRQAFEYGRWPRAAAEAVALLLLLSVAMTADAIPFRRLQKV